MQALSIVDNLLVFRAAEFAFALNANSIIKVVPSFETRKLHQGASTVLGLAVYTGEVIPVLDAARMFTPQGLREPRIPPDLLL